MAYTALYRKWRPQRFDEVRGQDHIVRTLKNQMNSDRVGHAYLFSGTRGTGKTSVAKIFARAVNCEHPVDGSPCNECPTCRSILAGTSVNVVEIDAASNNGVDNIREIREEVRYKPTEGRYRVYIIDEVHMLSTGAFNALLKTLEEPPSYVIFILATTEVNKIPITVLSRCQRYDFRRLDLGALKTQVTDLLKAEKVAYEEEAVSYIARKADGSSRDALSLLEQCISYFYGETLTYEKVLEVLGAASQQACTDLLEKILSCDVTGAVQTVDGLISAGRDLVQFTSDFIWYLRDLLLIQNEEPDAEALGISEEDLLEMKQTAEQMDMNQVMRYIRIFSELSNQLRYSSSRRVLFEVAVIKCMQAPMEADIESLTERIESLERTGIKMPAAGDKTSEIREQRRREPAAQEILEVSEAQMNDWKTVSPDWGDLVESQGKLFRSVFRGTSISAGEQAGALTVLFTDEYNCRAAEATGKAADVKQLLRDKYNKEFRIIFRCLKKNEAPPKLVLSPHIPGIEMEIGTEE